MGATYYMKNRKTKQYTYSLGKMGEFDPEAICFVLGWNNDDIEIENDHETWEIHGFNPQTGTQDPNQVWEKIDNIPWDNTFRYVFNYTKKEYIDMEKYQHITNENMDRILSRMNWNKDKVVFSTEASYEYRNLTNDESENLFFGTLCAYKRWN